MLHLLSLFCAWQDADQLSLSGQRLFAKASSSEGTWCFDR